MLSIPMSDAQFAAATARLRADGIAITGPNGTLSKDGITGEDMSMPTANSRSKSGRLASSSFRSR